MDNLDDYLRVTGSEMGMIREEVSSRFVSNHLGITVVIKDSYHAKSWKRNVLQRAIQPVMKTEKLHQLDPL